MSKSVKDAKEVSALDKIKEQGDEDKLYPVEPQEKFEESGSTSNNSKEKVCCIYDGTMESAVMIHKVVRDNKDVTVLQNDKIKFPSKINVDAKSINTIADVSDDDKKTKVEANKKKLTAFIKECGEYCKSKGIQKLYIPWTVDRMNSNPSLHDAFMNGVPNALGELSEFDDKGNETKFVRSVFYNYGTATDDILKNCKQYGLA
jgi:hypothetical protein